MVLDYTSKILQLAKFKPLLPSEVAHALSTDSIMISAMLSELVASGKLKVSFLKIGSSPLYYLPENVAVLENFVSHLNQKDQQTVGILKQNGVLQDRMLDPLSRVSLRQVKDFAKPLEVTVNGESQIFWKWFLLGDQETEALVKKILSIAEEAPKPPAQDTSQVSLQVSSNSQSSLSPVIVEPVKSEQVKSESVKSEQVKSESVNREFANQKSKDLKFTPPLPVPHQDMLAGVKEENVKKDAIKKEDVKEVKKEEISDPFMLELLKFFSSNNIFMMENTIIKKNSEVDFILEFDSLFGRLSYYCKAKKKKKISAADLYSSFVQGQLKKLPIIFLSNGELTKQAVEAVKALKGMTYKQLSLPN